MPTSRRAEPQSLSSVLSRAMYDIPTWMRGLLVVAGCGAAVVVVVASLVGGVEQTIRVDKLLHFGGYTTLAATFVLGLRPKWYLPALILLALLGMFIEYLQPLNHRSRDVMDLAANLLGLGTGVVIGLVCRIAFRAIRTHSKQARLRAQRRTYTRGAIILREGAEVSQFFIIERGEVRLSREVNQQQQVLGTLGRGDVFGLLGVLQSKPQYTTVEAIDDVAVYGLRLEDLLETSGGQDEPVAAVLNVMAKHLRALADRLVEAEQAIP